MRTKYQSGVEHLMGHESILRQMHLPHQDQIFQVI